MDKIEILLTRGVDRLYPTREELEKVLRSEKKLKLYQGFDPTGTDLHIGHMIGLRKLKQWQELGHEVIFLIGDGTGQAGDPSGKVSSREKFFTQEELRQNAKDYVMQASKIMNFEGENPVKILYNGDWLNKLSLVELLDLAGSFTVQQLIERDMFQDRLKKNEPINLREFVYPLLQGYDSVAMEVDLEIGGSDQTFNMLCGRTLLKAMKGKEKFVMTTPLLADSKGTKIGKSEGNVIGLTDKPEDLFRKIMNLGDDVVIKALEYLTDVPMEEIKEIEKKIENGENPMQFKKLLASEIVKQLNTDEDAKRAEEEFEKVVQHKELPTEIPTVNYSSTQPVVLSDLLVELNLVESKSDAKRLIMQSGVTINDNIVSNPTEAVSLKDGDIIRAGKRKYVKIKVE
jgi:tyrosyl-tRNA synthetase